MWGQGGMFLRSAESRLWDKYSIGGQLTKRSIWFYTTPKLYSFHAALVQNGI